VEIRNFGAYGLMLNNGSGNKFYNTSIILDPMPNYAWWPSDALNGTCAISNFFEDLTIVANELGGGVSLDRATITVRRGNIDLSALYANVFVNTTPGTELRIYQRDGDTTYHEIYSYRGYIRTVDSPSRSGFSWAMWPNADATLSAKALSLPPFQIALRANQTYVISCYIYQMSPCNSRLFCRGGQLSGIPNDTTSDTAVTSGEWTQLFLTVSHRDRHHRSGSPSMGQRRGYRDLFCRRTQGELVCRSRTQRTLNSLMTGPLGCGSI
jgi:hypothetical protein